MNKIKWLFVVLLILIIIYFLGPTPPRPQLTTQIIPLRIDISQLDNYLKKKENNINIKPQNEATIVWFDSVNKGRTEYAIVYLHGFSASHEEGNALHREFARTFGCNLYLHRLSEHGIKEKEALLKLTPEKLLESAKEALAIGKLLGKKVILMSTSTGGTLSLYLASGNSDLAGLYLFSPNIELKDPRSFILTQPWGLKIARLVNGSNYFHFDGPPGIDKFWTTTYRLEALISLKVLLETTMTNKTFEKVSVPTFIAYYSNDTEVSIPAMRAMYDQLKSPKKVMMAFPETGNHAIASSLWSKDVTNLKIQSFKFAEEVIGMKKY